MMQKHMWLMKGFTLPSRDTRSSFMEFPPRQVPLPSNALVSCVEDRQKKTCVISVKRVHPFLG